MKILLLPTYFFPENMAGTHLNDNKYQAFADNDIDMVCYVPYPTRGVNTEIRNKYSKIKHERLYNGKLEVNRFPLFKERQNPIQRAARYLLASAFQLFKGLFQKDVDILYLASTPPIQGVIGGIIKKYKKIPFIYNLQDIFPDSLVGTGLTKKNGFLWEIGRALEKFTYRNADKIIVISEDFKRNIMAKGVPEEKIEVVYNWVDEKIVVNVNRKNNVLFDKYSLDRDKFYVTYCGNIGLTQNMDMLLKVAESLSDKKDLQFVLIGEGAYKHTVENIIKERNIANVIVLPFQSYEEISYVFSLGDVGLIISKPGVGENSLPSKTWSIMSAERAVIANFDENEIKSIIEVNDCGIFTNAGDIEAFRKAILYFYVNRDECIRMGKNGRKFILDNLTKEIGVAKYIDIIRSFEKKK